MRIVNNLDELIEAAPVVKREAMNYFGDDEYLPGFP
jgi:biotin carboxylase